MTQKRLAECFGTVRSNMAPNALPSIDAIQTYVRELEADKERLDKLISFMVEDNDCTVVLHWNDYQDFAQVKLTDGTVLGEAMDSNQITEDMDGDESSAFVIRQAIDNARSE